MSAQDFGYSHSAAFAVLKNTKESIPQNLTTPQYMQALDELLQQAYLPLIEHTSAFETYLWQIIGWQETYRKRKVSFMSREDFILVALYWQSLTLKHEKVRLAPTLKLDRAILVDFVQSFLDSMQQYEQACNGLYCINGVPAPIELQRAYKLQVEQSCDTSRPLIGILRDARIWLERYLDLQSAVLQKYYRRCIVRAQMDYVSPQVFNKAVQLDDVAQVYVLAARRALDKCDQRQGTLTTQVGFQLFSARASLRPECAATQAHTALPEDPDEYQVDPAPTPIEALLNQHDNVRVQELARIVDPVGYGRAYLGMNESLPFIERSLPALL